MNHIRGSIHSMTIGGLIVRFITANFILFTIAFFSPQLTFFSIISFIVVATIITTFDYLFNAIIGAMPYPIIQGMIGFLTMAMILYFAQFFIPNITISGVATIMASLIYASIAFVMPNQMEE